MTGASHRYKIAAHWWIATEIVRRHPKLELAESYIQDGFYDMLTLWGNVDGRKIHIDFNRPGSIHVHPDHTGLMSADDAMSRDDAHWAVKRIEETAGLTLVAEAPASSTRVVTLRLMATFLNYVINDRYEWDLRMITAEGHGASLALLPSELNFEAATSFTEVFPRAKDFHAFLVSSEFPETLTVGRLWGLRRDKVVVAVFDTKGVVHTKDSSVALKPLFNRSSRNITRTMVDALGSLLP
jgi:hypothetical protein